MRIYDEFADALPKEVKEALALTTRRLSSFRNSDFLIPDLFAPSIHLLKMGGKMLRPSLLFLGAKAINQHCSDYIDLAAAIELLHVSSLIHDDIIDNGKRRRGVKSVNEKYGNEAALLAGNALISKAIHLSSRYGKDVMNSVSQTAMQMSAGEMMDYMSNRGGKPLTVKNYLEIAKLKTAALTGTSCNIVAVYKKSKAKSMLYSYGFNLGLAFQVRDDIMDYPQNSGNDSNIVSSIKQKQAVSKDKAVKEAAKINHYYVKQALKKAGNNEIGKFLGHYAKMIEVEF